MLPGVLLLAVACSGGGCISTKTKLAAANNVTELQSQIEKQESAQQGAVEALVRRTLELQREGLRYRWSGKKLDLQVQIYQRCDDRLNELRKELADQVNKALEPVEKRLNDEINAELPRGAAGTERANALRLQLASTLALVQQETSKNEMEIENEVKEARAGLLKQLDDAFKEVPANIDAPVSDADVSAVLGDYRKKSAEFRTSLKEATDSLREFVTVDEPWKLVLKGLVGDSLFGMIEPKLSQVFDDTRGKVESKLEQVTSALLQNAESKIRSLKSKG